MNIDTTDNIMDGILNRIINLSKNTVEHDAFDRMTFDRVAKKCGKLNDIRDTALGKSPASEEEKTYHYPFITELQQDIFYSFFKYNPKFINDDKIQQEFRVHKEMIKKAQKNENWRKMRNMTKLDEVNSTIATAYFSEELVREISKRDKKLQKQIQELQKQRQQIIDLMKDFANAKKEADKKQLAEQIEKVTQEIQQKSEQAMKNISQISVSQAIKNATKKMAEYHETTNTLMWGTETSQMRKVNPEERIALANYLLTNEKLFKLVKELGKLKNIFAETKRREIKHGTSEIYSIGTGRDLGRILPCEVLKMRHPVLKKDFYKRFLDGSLLEYSLRSKEKMGKGNIIVCLDCSGSMSSKLYDEISRELYAKALALAILELAVRDNRNYHLIMFEATIKQEYKFGKDKKPNVNDIISIANTTYTGGTNFDAPLEKAISSINEEGDIVFITDGMCKVGNDFLKKFNEVKKKLNFQVVSLQVGNSSTKYLEDFSDDVINFTKFIETSKSVFSALVKGGDKI